MDNGWETTTQFLVAFTKKLLLIFMYIIAEHISARHLIRQYGSFLVDVCM